jgi:uncharacterized protein
MSSSLADVLRRIGQVAEFSEIPVTDANTLGLFKNRPLHIAAVWGDCDAIEQLVNSGASIDAKGEHGFTALMEAAAQNHFSACQLLVSLGASSIPNDDGQIPSEYAAVRNYQELAAWLRASGF